MNRVSQGILTTLLGVSLWHTTSCPVLAAGLPGAPQGQKAQFGRDTARAPVYRVNPASVPVGVRQAPGQPDPTSSSTVEFEVLFAQPIFPASFEPSDIVQNGTSLVGAWVITDPDGDAQTFNLTATGAGPGTVIPSLPPNVVGTPGTCSTGSANPGADCGADADCPDGSGTGACEGSLGNLSSTAVDNSVTVGPVSCAGLTYLYVGVWSPPTLYRYCVEANGSLTFETSQPTSADVRDLAAGFGGLHLYYASDGLTKYFVSTDGSLLAAGTIPVGSGTFDDIELEPAGRYLYGSHSKGGGRIYVYDTQTATNLPQEIQVVTGLTSPHGVAAAAAGSKLYVANQVDFLNNTANQEEIVMFDRFPNGTISFSGATTWGATPDYFAAHPTQPFVYHTDRPGSRVRSSQLAGASLLQGASLFSGYGASQLALNAAGTRLYVANYNANTVSVFQTAGTTLTLLESVPTATKPQHVVLHPDGTYLYVASAGNVTGTSTIDVYQIGADGKLTLVQAKGIADQGAYRMVIVSFD